MFWVWQFTYRARHPIGRVSRSGSSSGFVNREGLVIAGESETDARAKVAEWLESRGYAPDNYRKLERFCRADLRTVIHQGLWPTKNALGRRSTRNKLSLEQCLEIVGGEVLQRQERLEEVAKSIEARRRSVTDALPVMHDHLDESDCISIGSGPPALVDPNGCFASVFSPLQDYFRKDQ